MRTRPLILLSALVALGLGGIAALALSRLPAGVHLPVHWNADGQPNGFAPAGTALFMPVIVTVVMSALLACLPGIEPLQRGLEESAPLLIHSWLGLLLILILVEFGIAAPAFGLTMPPMLFLVGVGLLFLVIGNALPKSRPGFFVGIRTPWTLIDRDNWIATHRFGSRTMMGSGILILLAALLPLRGGQRTGVILLATAVAVIPPVIYSYVYWRRNGRRT